MGKIAKFISVISAVAVSWTAATFTAGARQPVLAPSTAWGVESPLGERTKATIDTLYEDYSHRFVPQEVSPAWAATGNYCAEGRQMIWMDRPVMSDFFFRDAVATWTPSLEKARFYNTRIPMTLLGYSFGGGGTTGQDDLSVRFSANAGPRVQVGALLDYIYSKGSYENQAAKDLTWGFSGSYTGERFEFQGFFTHYSLLAKENGGITDELYITDPAAVQGGNTSVNAKSIPTNLTAAHNRLTGTDLWLNSRYKLGFYKEEQVNDTTTRQVLVPVTSFIWTLRFRDGFHRFTDQNATENTRFWPQTYFNLDETSDRQKFYSVQNTLGVALLEGFNKWAKAGLTAFITLENRHYEMETLIPETSETPLPPDENEPAVDPDDTPQPALSADPHPSMITRQNQTLLWVGAQLLRSQGKLLNYDVTGQLGLIGDAVGEVKVDGRINTSFRLLGDTAQVNAVGHFTNLSAPWFMRHFRSNHFIWENDFGKTRSLRLGGEIMLGRTGTFISAGVENVQNLIYFNAAGYPVQEGGSVQIVSARLRQNFKFGPVHWDNDLIFQTSSRENVVPLPKFTVFSNLYAIFRIATLKLQFGVSCDYFTRYRSLGFQPETMSFTNRNEAMVGNYPFINVYLNCKLSKTRFFLMMSHVNQGLTGTNYFSMTGYPMNPRRFQLGISIDFAN